MNAVLAIGLTGVGVAAGIYVFAVFMAWWVSDGVIDALVLAAKVTAALMGVLIVFGAVIVFILMVWAGVDA